MVENSWGESAERKKKVRTFYANSNLASSSYRYWLQCRSCRWIPLLAAATRFTYKVHVNLKHILVNPVARGGSVCERVGVVAICRYSMLGQSSWCGARAVGWAVVLQYLKPEMQAMKSWAGGRCGNSFWWLALVGIWLKGWAGKSLDRWMSDSSWKHVLSGPSHSDKCIGLPIARPIRECMCGRSDVV